MYLNCYFLDSNDLIVVGSNLAPVEEFKQARKDVFEITHVRLMTYFWGMEIIQKKNEHFTYFVIKN